MNVYEYAYLYRFLEGNYFLEVQEKSMRQISVNSVVTHFNRMCLQSPDNLFISTVYLF